MQKKFFREVLVMWQNRHGLSTNRLLNLGDWLAAFGLIPFIIAAIYNEGKFARPILISLGVICFIVLVASFFRATCDVWRKDTTKLSLINEQKNNIHRFLSSRFTHFYFRNNRQLDIEVEWFNGTVFSLEFGTTSGMVKVNGFECKITSVEKATCSPGERCSYRVTLPQDSDILQTVRDAISQIKTIKLYVLLNTDVKVIYEYDGRPESSKTINAQHSSDNPNVIPEKV
jgi:hypothetical protein